MEKIKHGAVISFFIKKDLKLTETFNETKNVLGDTRPSFTTAKK